VVGPFSSSASFRFPSPPRINSLSTTLKRWEEFCLREPFSSRRRAAPARIHGVPDHPSPKPFSVLARNCCPCNYAGTARGPRTCDRTFLGLPAL